MDDARAKAELERFVMATVSRALRGETVSGYRLEARNVRAGATALLERGNVQRALDRLSETFEVDEDGLTPGPTQADVDDERILRADGSWIPQPAGGVPAPASASFVAWQTDPDLTDERILTGTTNQIDVTVGPTNIVVSLAAAVVYGVSSVFGRTGAVVAVLGDYVASLVGNDSGVVGATVKAALDTLDAAISSVSSTLAAHLAVNAVTGHGTVGAHDHTTGANGGQIGTGGLLDDAVDFAKLIGATAASRLLGRGSAGGAGSFEEITLSASLAMSGTQLQRGPLTGDVTAVAGLNATSIANNVVGDAQLRDSAALSVIGRAANSAGDPADIAAGTDGHVLRRSGTALGFGTLAAGAFANNTVPIAALANASATDHFLARDTAGAGAWEDITAAAARSMMSGVLAIYGSWYGGVVALSNSADTTLILGVEAINLGITFNDGNDTISPGAHDAIEFGYSVTLEATAAVNCRVYVWLEEDPNTGTFVAVPGTQADGHVHTTGTANLHRITLACGRIMATSANYLYRLRARFVGTSGGVSTVASGTRLWCHSVGVN